MFTDHPPHLPLHITFLLIPGYSMIGVSAMIDPLRWANRIKEKDVYEWEIVSLESESVCASNGLVLESTRMLTDLESTDMLVVCAGFDPHRHEGPSVFGQLRRLAQQGTVLGGQDTGSHLLAAAGLLDGYRAAMHWEHLNSFTEDFPDVEAVDDIYEVDRDRFSCSGGLSGLDLMLHLIEGMYGSELALAVSDELIYTHRRQADHPQRMTIQARFGINNAKLITAIKVMQRKLEDPLSIAALANQVHVSERELERLFRKFLDTTPVTFYRDLRLEQARLLLHQTARNITSVAVACGFTSVSHFSRCYKARYGRTPSKDRIAESYST